MKKMIVGAACMAALCIVTRVSAQDFNFSNIQYWVGSGTNEAAMVIDWQDSATYTGSTPESLVWGFRFNANSTDPVTGLDMLQAIAAADPRLDVFASLNGTGPVEPISSFTSYAEEPEVFVYGIGYNPSGTGGFTPGTPDTDEGGSGPAGDHYEEGEYTGFWGYLAYDPPTSTTNGSPNPFDDGSGDVWPGAYGPGTGAATGPGGRDLENGSWDAFSFSTDTVDYLIPNPNLPTAVSAAPEPSSFCLVALAAAGGYALLRKKRVR